VGADNRDRLVAAQICGDRCRGAALTFRVVTNTNTTPEPRWKPEKRSVASIFAFK
jgi:hypothetical protein